MQGIYIPHFNQISVKISVLVLLYPNHCTDWGEIWHGGVPSSVPGPLVPPPCQISLQSVQRVAPVGRKTSKSASG